MAMQRVLLVTNIFPPLIGGPATFIDKLAHLLSWKGYGVTVVCSSMGPSEQSDASRPFQVLRVDLTNRELYEIRIRLVLLREMLRHRFIFVNGLEFHSHQVACLLRRSFTLKVVGDTVWETARNRGTTALNIDDFQVDREAQASMSSLIKRRNMWFKRAAKILVPSQYVKKVVVGWGVDPQRVSIVLNGIDKEEFSPFGSKRREDQILNVIFVGRLTNWKGVETLLLTLTNVNNVKATIVGAGPELPHLLELSRQLGLQSRVRFTGCLDRDEVKRKMAQAHVLVLTSLYEGLSHTVLEAMAMGIPCVVSSCGGNEELVESGRDGVVISPQDVAALTDALRRLQGDEERRLRLARAARIKSQNFSMDDTVNQIEKLLLD